MLRLRVRLPAIAVSSFRSRHDLLLENLALRQQLTTLKQRHPQPRRECRAILILNSLRTPLPRNEPELLDISMGQVRNIEGKNGCFR